MFSKNVGHTRCEELSNLFGFCHTSNLGRYLGVPFLYERCKVSDFQFIIDRMTQRLNGWKTRTLSLAGRITLAKSALATIPSYIMQIMKLPIIVCAKIDKLCRQFIWGSSENNRNIHLVNWNKICSSKEEGGL